MTMGTWVDLGSELPALRGSGVHVLPAGAEAGLRRVLEGHGFEMRVVECGAVRDEASLFSALDRGLALPDYFGGNWDALDECVAEVFAQEGPPLAVVFRDVHVLLGADVQAFVMLVALLDRAIDFAADRGNVPPRQCEVFVLGEGPAFG
jgi:RNAse (barnase) inhibitor barstar